MRAKFVNEIKKSTKTSSFSGLKVGNVKVFPAYEKTKSEWPQVFNVFDNFRSLIAEDSPLDTWTFKIMEKIGKKPTDAVWAYDDWLISLSTDSFEEELKEFKSMWSNSPNLIKLQFSPNVDYIFIYYDETLRMGQFVEDLNEDVKFFFLINN